MTKNYAWSTVKRIVRNCIAHPFISQQPFLYMFTNFSWKNTDTLAELEQTHDHILHDPTLLGIYNEWQCHALAMDNKTNKTKNHIRISAIIGYTFNRLITATFVKNLYVHCQKRKSIWLNSFSVIPAKLFSHVAQILYIPVLWSKFYVLSEKKISCEYAYVQNSVERLDEMWCFRSSLYLILANFVGSIGARYVC